LTPDAPVVPGALELAVADPLAGALAELPVEAACEDAAELAAEEAVPDDAAEVADDAADDAAEVADDAADDAAEVADDAAEVAAGALEAEVVPELPDFVLPQAASVTHASTASAATAGRRPALIRVMVLPSFRGWGVGSDRSCWDSGC
jgi:hypothetical protein